MYKYIKPVSEQWLTPEMHSTALLAPPDSSSLSYSVDVMFIRFTSQVAIRLCTGPPGPGPGPGPPGPGSGPGPGPPAHRVAAPAYKILSYFIRSESKLSTLRHATCRVFE